MSGSPKYNVVSSGEARRRQAERERQERERRRREQERKRREAALEQARKAALAQAAELGRRLAELRREAEQVGAGEAGATAATALTRAEQAVRDAGDQQAVAQAALGVQRHEHTLLELRQQIHARRRQVAADRVAAVAALLDAVPAADRQHYDAPGADEVRELLRAAGRYADKDPANVDRRVAAATDAVREHLDRVLGRRAQEQARTAAATEAVREVTARLAGLAADAEQARVPLPGVERAREAVDGLAGALDAGDLDALTTGLPEATRRLDEAEAALDDVIDRIVQRRELLTSIIRALPDAGFDVDRDSFEQTDDGAMQVRAVSHAGQRFAVLLRDRTAGADATGAQRGEAAGPDGTGPDGGPGGPGDPGTEVLYTTDTMAEAVAAGTGGGCAPLLSVIEQLSEQARRDGFEPGEVRWDDAGDGHRRPPGATASGPAAAPRTRSAG